MIQLRKSKGALAFAVATLVAATCAMSSANGQETLAQRLRKAHILFAPRPEDPSFSGKHRPHGHGRYRLRLNEAGKVATVEIIRSTGTPFLDKAAIATLKTWRCEPGAYKLMTVPVYFDEEPPAQGRGPAGSVPYGGAGEKMRSR